jgi:hypothetical protein
MLSLSQRRTLEKLHRKRCSQAAIARQLGVHRSTVKRELERNSVEGKYQALQAQELSTQRKQLAGKENQKKRRFRYYDVSTLIETRIKRADARLNRETKAISLQKKRFRHKDWFQFRFSRKLFAEDRFNRMRRQKRKEHYYKWKSNYNRYFRERDHWRENFYRRQRSTWEKRMCLRPGKWWKRYRPDSYRHKEKIRLYDLRLRQELFALIKKLKLMNQTLEELNRKPQSLIVSYTVYPFFITLIGVDGITMPVLFCSKIFNSFFREEDFVFNFSGIK